MDSKRAILIFLLTGAALIVAMAALNYRTDPLCFFRCEKTEVDRKNLNSYYQNLQRVLKFPESELVVLGSSRGESLPLGELERSHRMKALNLSVGGADIHAKLAFLAFARQNLKLRRVIWLADYFELIDASMGDKMKFTPPLRALADLPFSWRTETEKVSALLDHTTLEATFALLRGKKTMLPTERGPNESMRQSDCTGQIEKSPLTEARLLKEVGMIYDGYANRILVPKQNPDSLKRLREALSDLVNNKIEVIVVVPPYHPEFTRRLGAEHPEIMARHRAWVLDLKNLANVRIEVRDFFSSDAYSARPASHWTDGVHFNCSAAAEMLAAKP